MSVKSPFRSLSRVTPPDPELAERQWAEWALTRRHLLKASGFAVGALGLAGTGLVSRPAIRVAAQDGEPKYGGAISMSLADSDVTSFDPIVPFDNMSIWTMLLIYDQIIRVGPDGLSLEPCLAESWEASDDGLSYTFHLRQTNFHDGTPCTAEDVAFCLERCALDEASGWAFLFGAVDTIEATDPQTLTVTLSSTWAPFEADLALYGASIFSKAAYDAQGDELWEHPIGTGSYMFDSWQKEAQVVLKKNPSYWDEGKPYLDELTFKVLIDSNARVLQLQGRELDIATDVPFNQVEPLSQNPEYVLVPDAVARIDYIALNLLRPPFDDKNVRQAINYAVDKDAIIQNVLFGAGQPANTYLPLMPYHDPDLPGYPYDLDKAKALMAESAYKDGFEFQIMITVGNPVESQVCQLVAAQLAEIGGTVTIEQVEPGIGRERVTVTQDFDASKSYYTTDIIDPDELTAFAVLSNGGAKAVWTSYVNEEADRLILEGQIEIDPAKRQEIYTQIQQIHLDDAPFIFLFYPTGRTATQAYVKNFHVLPTGNYRLFETWRDDV